MISVETVDVRQAVELTTGTAALVLSVGLVGEPGSFDVAMTPARACELLGKLWLALSGPPFPNGEANGG